MATQTPINITSTSEFDALLSSTRYVLVDFWADWCPPCKAIGPIFSKIASGNTIPGKLAFAKVDLEETPDIAERYSVSNIPAFLVFKKGEWTSIDLGDKIKKGPTVVLEEGTGFLKRVAGADPRVLMVLVGELARLAQEDGEEETPAAPAPAAEETKDAKKEDEKAKEEPNELFAKEDEDW